MEAHPLLRRAVLFSVVFLCPFLIQLATSFKTDADATNNPLSLIPHPLDTAAWKRIFGFTDNAPVRSRWLGNSIVATLIVTGGAGLPRQPGRVRAGPAALPRPQAVFWSILAVLSVPGAVLLIPRFLVLSELGIYNTYPGMILPILVDAAGVFLMRQFFDRIP